MDLTEFKNHIEEMEDVEYPISTTDLATKHRQISGDTVAKLLEESDKEEFDSLDEISSWMDKQGITFGVETNGSQSPTMGWQGLRDRLMSFLTNRD